MIATLAAIRTVECLTFQPSSLYGDQMFTALAKSVPAGITVKATTQYDGGSDVLMLWGPGGLARFSPMRHQLAKGGHVIAFDLAYWQRESKVRVSIDAAHPQAWVMKQDWPASRFEADGVRVAHAWDPKGPVIIAGIGPKARAQYGAGVVDAWEADMVRACGPRRVLYRRKNKIGSAPAGSTLAKDGPIESVLAGASLLVTWHSNVAVDAIRLGIPVVCKDGAAAAVCPSTLPDQPEPLPIAVRDTFLANLSHFQYAPAEAGLCWTFLQEILA